MSNFFANKRLIVLLSSLIILIILMGVTLGERENATWPEKFVRDSMALGQGIFSQPAQSFSRFIDNIQHMYRVYEENRILKQNLDRLAQLSAEVKRLQSENDRLREMLGAKSTYKNYQLRFAEVIGRSPDRWNQVIVIDLGSKDGIKAGMAVVTAKGMIGRVQSASHFSSQVELLSDIERGNFLSAIIQAEQTVYGVIEGYDVKQNILIMRKIPLGAEIKQGETVITSGLGDPAIPPGIIIGEIVGISPSDYGLTQVAYIKPSADFYRLNEVYVVERYLPDSQHQGENAEGDKREQEAQAQ
ncbi:MAG: rod shape-determining protein MreC [Bacillaceae bacterium]|nr:rod shape-determining protein MreC [Bacillaceae bacterium]